MVHLTGLEPARISPLPPQSSVSAYSTTSAYSARCGTRTQPRASSRKVMTSYWNINRYSSSHIVGGQGFRWEPPYHLNLFMCWWSWHPPSPSFGTSHQPESNWSVQGVEPFSTWRDNHCPLFIAWLTASVQRQCFTDPQNNAVHQTPLSRFVTPTSFDELLRWMRHIIHK